MSLFKVFYAGVVVEDSILLPRCYEKYHNYDNFAKLFQSLLRFQEHIVSFCILVDRGHAKEQITRTLVKEVFLWICTG